MKTVQKILRVLADRSGATAIEYALIAGIICIAIVGGATTLGTQTNDSFNELKTSGFGT